jgi:hypothetical protein
MNELRRRFLMTLSILTVLLGSQVILFAQNVITSSDFESGSTFFVYKAPKKFFSKRKNPPAKISKEVKQKPATSSSRKTTVEVIEPIADEDWINEQADNAIEERKVSDSEPFLSLPEGFLNSRAYFCESPQFPAAALKAKRKEVKLKTLVTVGQYGGILQASALEGDADFRAAVYKILGSMSFRQSFFMGKPVRIEGHLYFTQNPKNAVLCRESTQELEVPAVIDGGELTGSAKTCETPDFPADAKTAGLKTVEAKIKVIVDEQGKVMKAEPLGGHKTFGEAAVNAALKTIFPRSMIAGKPVKVGGLLVFNQTPNNDVRCTVGKAN